MEMKDCLIASPKLKVYVEEQVKEAKKAERKQVYTEIAKILDNWALRPSYALEQIGEIVKQEVSK